ncbi:MAG: hypothetical protein WA949_10850 [Phormidesmis sp.]
MSLSSALATLLLSANLLAADPSVEQIRFCESLTADGWSQPARASRTLRLDGLGIEVDIPENFRAMRTHGNSVSILAPEEYDYVQCIDEIQLRGDPVFVQVVLDQDEPTSEALIRSQSGEAMGPQLLGKTVVDGQPAFIYSIGGMTDGLVVRINYPDQEASLVIWTPLEDDNQVPMQETVERILSTLTFL